MMKPVPGLGWLLTAFLFATLAGAQTRDEKTGKESSRADSADVKKLVSQLSSSDFKTRANAERELMKLETVPDSLRDALQNGDLETRRRAKSIVDGITARLEEKAFQTMLVEVNKIDVDRFVRRMVIDEKFATDKHWAIVETFAKAAVKKANAMAERQYDVPSFDMKSMPLANLALGRVAFNQNRMLLKETDRRSTSISDCVVLCAGNMPRTTRLVRSVVIIDGDFIGATSITSSLLIVRGNVGRVTGVTKSIILATGNFEGATVCHESFLQVNNTWIRFTGSNNSVFVKTQVRTTGNTNAVVLDADKGPLQLLKFSERKADDKVAWGKEVNSLAVAIMPTEQKDRFLIRWKNVGDVAFALPMVRLNRDVSDPQRDDLLDHVFLKGPDGKLANARKYPPVRAGGPPRVLMNAAVLGAGKGHEEIIDLWTYVERPANSGRFQLSIEFENPESRRAILFNEFKTWSGKVQSNSLDVDLAK